MDSSIQVVVFDIGGVMIRLAGGWVSACESAGICYRPFAMTPELRDGFAELERLISTNAISISCYGRRAACLLADLYSPDEIIDIYQAIIREEHPGIYELVRQLKQAGVRTACLSNTCAAHWEDLTNPTLYPGICALDFQHASHLFGVAKPDTRIYRHFERATGFSADEILFFDDLGDNIEGAHACGWSAEQILASCSPVEQIYAALPQYGISLKALASCSCPRRS